MVKKPRPPDPPGPPGGTDAGRFSRAMIVAAALDQDERAKDVLLEFGLPCWKCVVSETETLEEGCRPLQIDVDLVVRRLNALPPR